MSDNLTPEQRGWLRVMYEEELDLPLDDDLDEDGVDEDGLQTMIPADALGDALETRDSLIAMGLIAMGESGLYELTPKGRQLAQTLLT